MQYDGLIIRPPSEAGSLILQVTVGCSHNRCTFCPAYKQKTFRIKTPDETACAIDEAARSSGGDVRRVFLCDGDPLCMPPDELLRISEILQQRFSRLQRIGIYATAANILHQGEEVLRRLKQHRFGIVYMGLESGDDAVLASVGKGATAEQMIAAAQVVRRAGLKLNVTVLLGIGGRDGSDRHARETIRVLNAMQPNHVGALTLMLVPGTPLFDDCEAGRFVMPDKFELVGELRTMIEGSTLENCLFFSNHASNYFPVRARLPRDREMILESLDRVLAARDDRALRAEHLRAL